jgi:hypothetical protein
VVAALVVALPIATAAVGFAGGEWPAARRLPRRMALMSRQQLTQLAHLVHTYRGGGFPPQERRPVLPIDNLQPAPWATMGGTHADERQVKPPADTIGGMPGPLPWSRGS